MTLGVYLGRWLTLREKALAPRTVESYRRIIGHVQPISDRPMEELSVWDVQTTLEGPISEGHLRTAQQIFVLLRTALGDAERMRLIDHNPVDKLLRPRHKPAEHAVWDLDQTKAFIQAALADRQGLAVLLPLLCGLRRGEVLGLQWGDVDMAAGMLHIRRQLVLLDDGKTMLTPPKSEAGIRDVPIPGLLRPLISSQRQLCGEVVTLTHSGLRTALKRVSEHAGVPHIGLHGLRHTFATNCIRAGGDMRALQKVLGHASYSTTADIYTHPDPDQLISMVAQCNALVV